MKVVPNNYQLIMMFNYVWFIGFFFNLSGPLDLLLHLRVLRTNAQYFHLYVNLGAFVQ